MNFFTCSVYWFNKFGHNVRFTENGRKTYCQYAKEQPNHQEMSPLKLESLYEGSRREDGINGLSV